MKNNVLLLAITGLTMCTSPLVHATCNTNLPETTPTQRFDNNLDGTVTDLKTGLMWKQCVEGMTAQGTTACVGTALTFGWQSALQQVQVVNGDPSQNLGYSDWRMPNIKELQTIVERQCDSPAINQAVFPNDPGTYTWSSTSNKIPANGAWRTGFDTGNAISSGLSNLTNIRLVRGMEP
ncbi:MAG: DUF1566 domain-containing protein [Gammaproteobacteria bacterium]|nr:DUF1566 domain-containing protein [Gammaproteobacteria bacterium]